MLRWLVITVLLLSGCESPPPRTKSQIMDRIEASWRIPMAFGWRVFGWRGVGRYNRFYGLSADRRKVHAAFIIPPFGEEPARYWVGDLPPAQGWDMGCNKIEIVYDVASQTVEQAQCDATL